MNIDDFIKSRFPQYYKAKNSNFDMSAVQQQRTNRIKEQNIERKNVRSQVLLQRRNISESPASEIQLPVASKKSSKNDLLKVWKEQKKRKLEAEKAKRKPVFKVGCARNVGFPDFNSNSVYSSSIAPKNFKFKPPENIKPISLAKVSKKTPTVIQFDDKKTKASTTNASRRVTRSQKAPALPPLPLPIRTNKSTVLRDNGSIKNSAAAPRNVQQKLQKKIPVRQLAICDNSVNKDTKKIATAAGLSQTNNNETIGKRKTPNRKDSLRTNLNGTYYKAHNNLNSNNDYVNQKENILFNRENANSAEEFQIKHSNKNTSKTPDLGRQSRRKSTKKSISEKKIHESVSSSEENNVVARSKLSMSPEYPIIDVSTDDATPENNMTTTPNDQRSAIYISPFVTTSRGKGNVKKENLKRQIRGLPAFTQHKTPDENTNKQVQRAGAEYFYTVLNNEISRLLSLCDTWCTCKDKEKLTEDAKDLIDVAVGQANLLINKKFQQFRGLINACQTGEGEKMITCEDLQGFWDMVYMQVENLNLRFTRLLEMKNNNWEEITPEIKTKVIKKKAPPKRTKASSNLKAAIQARRNAMQTRSQKKQSEKEEINSGLDENFFVVKSPNTISSSVKTPRKTLAKNALENSPSVLASVLQSETRKSLAKSRESPGVIMMAVSQTAKELKRISTGLASVVVSQTPSKSILKNTQKEKSRRNKTVLFKDENSDVENSSKERLQSNRRNSDLIRFDSLSPK